MSEYKKEEWRVKQPAADIRALAERFSISPILAHIIVNREITEPDAVACYLSDDLAYTHDPALMKDMDKGCQIMKEKIRAGKKIRIISDYDVDGITSNYILYQGLQKAGADVSYDIPHRIMDGYGMNGWWKRHTPMAWIRLSPVTMELRRRPQSPGRKNLE